MTKSQVPAPVRQKIEETLQGHPTVLYMKGTPSLPQCGFSAQVASVLKRMGVTFHSVNVLADPEIRDGIKVYADWPTIPQLYHKGELVGGCDIVTAMAQNGELEKVLGA